MKRKNLFLSVCFLSGFLSLSAQQPARQAKDTLRDNAIVPPEVLNQHLATLLHDWQLEFSKSENDCSRGANVIYSDTVYMHRLYKLPSEMELSYNQVVRSYIDMYANRKRELVGYMLALGDYYFPMFEEALDRYGLPLELKYLPVIESALNPVAVSRVGATGLWQFMLKTGKGYGLDVNSLVDERRDPYKATDAAARYLKDLYAIYGDWNLVIAAYNCGPGNVNKAIARSGGKNDYWQIYYGLPRETRGYVPAFIAANYIMNYYDKHHICPEVLYSPMSALDTIHVDKEIHFAQISAVLGVPIDEIRRLNPQFKKDIIPGNFHTYALVLPTNKAVAFIDKRNEILEYRKNEYLVHRANTDEFVRSDELSGGTSANVYYRVRKGDNLGKIAQRNGVTVAQLKSWNGLRSTKLSIGKRLIVKKRAAAPVSTPQPAERVLAQNTDTVADPATSGPISKGSIIAQYFEQQHSKHASPENNIVLAEGMAASESELEQPEPIEEQTVEQPEDSLSSEDISDVEPIEPTEPQVYPKTTTTIVYYKVRKGDNLEKIARRHGVTVEQLKLWNGLNSTKISVGDRLVVNEKKTVAAAVTDNKEAALSPSVRDPLFHNSHASQ
ncbi:MAG: LysM peptidoglycan-binding domain-containing protein [Dysgonamonadaceae bacterium]|jgi:membrane-bound lytic murein transglycosylase D|nr:LysM peptidoglycan-binding domain-containing protein [Dysgonamonadaceae bacterium]